MAFLALMPATTTSADSGSLEQPNILLVVTDDQMWDTAFAMPKIEALAEGGVRFTNAFTATPLCGPTRATLHAGGFRPDSTGIVSNLRPNGGVGRFNDTRTIATAFQGAGYKTLHLGKYLNGYVAEGVEPYIPPGWTRFVHADTVGSSTEVSSMGTLQPPLDPVRLYHYREHAIGFIDEFAGSPFFIMLETERPHWPSIPLPGDSGLFPDFLYRGRGYAESDLTDKPPVVRLRSRSYPE